MIDLFFSSELTLSVIAFRLLLSFLAGGLVGAERERHTSPAGLRTHILICTGATLLMLLSLSVAGIKGDPARIAAQVVSGIGFLGAGAILRFGATVQGLTSAASIWAVAALGLAIGAGFIPAALIFMILLLIALIILDHFEKRYIHHHELKAVRIWQKGENFDTDFYQAALRKYGAIIKNVEIAFSKEKMETMIKFVVKIPKGVNLSELAAELNSRKKVIKLRLNQEL